MARPDPFDNRIRELNKWKATDELTQVTFDMGHEAALTWDLPAAYVCVVRAVKQDGTIQERAYRQANAAKRYMKGLLMNDDDYIVMTGNAVMDTQTEIPWTHVTSPRFLTDSATTSMMTLARWC